MTRRELLAPAYPDDTGAADEALAAALAAWAQEPTPQRRAQALARLQDTRVLVPVVAVLGEMEIDEHGLAHDKSADMAAVLLTGRDGRRALLGFTSLETMTRWDPQARPVPVTALTAAQAAVQEDADALVLDVAGPVMLAVEGEELRALAAGWRLVQMGDDFGWVRAADDVD